MSSPVAFSITWQQLEALRSLPRPVPERSYLYVPDRRLIDKGLADIVRRGIQVTPKAGICAQPWPG
jgi:hypothetical protein